MNDNKLINEAFQKVQEAEELSPGEPTQGNSILNKKADHQQLTAVAHEIMKRFPQLSWPQCYMVSAAMVYAQDSPDFKKDYGTFGSAELNEAFTHILQGSEGHLHFRG